MPIRNCSAFFDHYTLPSQILYKEIVWGIQGYLTGIKIAGLFLKNYSRTV
jgi:hypothetical protein